MDEAAAGEDLLELYLDGLRGDTDRDVPRRGHISPFVADRRSPAVAILQRPAWPLFHRDDFYVAFAPQNVYAYHMGMALERKIHHGVAHPQLADPNRLEPVGQHGVIKADLLLGLMDGKTEASLEQQKHGSG